MSFLQAVSLCLRLVVINPLRVRHIAPVPIDSHAHQHRIGVSTPFPLLYRVLWIRRAKLNTENSKRPCEQSRGWMSMQKTILDPGKALLLRGKEMQGHEKKGHARAWVTQQSWHVADGWPDETQWDNRLGNLGIPVIHPLQSISFFTGWVTTRDKKGWRLDDLYSCVD